MKRLMVEKNRYFDSVFLMRISASLEKLDGVRQAVVAMATPLNVASLSEAGFEGMESVQPADLLIALDVESERVAEEAHDHLTSLLAGPGHDPATEAAAAMRPAATLDEALVVDPEANLALISVPGEYAAREARMALRRGLHVMLFSDHVSLDDEVALKQDAEQRGLLLMGPDCGTAILSGVPLGFANACRRGTIGIVGASGTGIQEISSLIHRGGGGISHAIGTGGRDLSPRVGGRMMRQGMAALARDDDTAVIVVVSKTPPQDVAERMLQELADTRKPAVVHFIGGRAERRSETVEIAETLAGAAHAALAKAGVSVPAAEESATALAKLTTRPARGRLLGLFCGGTLCQEAWSILRRQGFVVESNVAGESSTAGERGPMKGRDELWDLGDDLFTQGRPHPMIEPELRDARVAEAGADPSVGMVWVDCVLGFGAHQDPAGGLARAAGVAMKRAQADGRTLVVVASITGTDQDPQGLFRQQTRLEEAGVVLFSSNAAAAHAVAHWMGSREVPDG